MMFFGPNAESPPKEDPGIGRGEADFAHLRHVPLVELDADVALDPGKGVFLSDGEQHVVAAVPDVRLAGGDETAAAALVDLRRDLLEGHAGQHAEIVGEFLGHQEVEDRDVLVHRVFLLPRRRLHLLEAGSDDDLDVLAAKSAGGAAAVHGGVAATQNDHPPTDLLDVTEGDAGEPVDADVNVGGGLFAAWDLEVSPTRRAGTDEDGVVVFRQNRF